MTRWNNWQRRFRQGFNGAAANCRGKWREDSGFVPEQIELQWGRGKLPRKIRRAIPSARRSRTASMGPRQIAAENAGRT
jgi:hypothetical protein